MRYYLLILLLMVSAASASTSGLCAQETRLSLDDRFFAPADMLDRQRFGWSLGIGTTAYVVGSTWLYTSWYADYPRSSFQFFDDSREWRGMDKAGHVFSAYMQGAICYRGARWTGLSERKSILVGAISGGLFQTTIEVMDGFSSEWGFSVADLGANLLGTGLWAAQQLYWGEQRLAVKFSSHRQAYSAAPISDPLSSTVVSYESRAYDLYGASSIERYLKDYNAQTYWLSINVASWLSEDTRWPAWLNVAIGYGADNMYGGFDNQWQDASGQMYDVSEERPRLSQFYISPDIDLSRVTTRWHWLNGIFHIANVFKTPAPAIEINTQGQVIFHLLR